MSGYDPHTNAAKRKLIKELEKKYEPTGRSLYIMIPDAYTDIYQPIDETFMSYLDGLQEQIVDAIIVELVEKAQIPSPTNTIAEIPQKKQNFLCALSVLLKEYNKPKRSAAANNASLRANVNATNRGALVKTVAEIIVNGIENSGLKGNVQHNPSNGQPNPSNGLISDSQTGFPLCHAALTRNMSGITDAAMRKRIQEYLGSDWIVPVPNVSVSSASSSASSSYPRPSSSASSAAAPLPTIKFTNPTPDILMCSNSSSASSASNSSVTDGFCIESRNDKNITLIHPKLYAFWLTHLMSSNNETTRKTKTTNDVMRTFITVGKDIFDRSSDLPKILSSIKTLLPTEIKDDHNNILYTLLQQKVYGMIPPLLAKFLPEAPNIILRSSMPWIHFESNESNLVYTVHQNINYELIQAEPLLLSKIKCKMTINLTFVEKVFTGTITVTAEITDPELEIILVRHSISEQNQRGYLSKLSYGLVKDPALSNDGLNRLHDIGDDLYIKLCKEGRKPNIAASTLRRAQITAMCLASPLIDAANPIEILPYTSETGIGADNLPLTISEQDIYYKDLQVYNNIQSTRDLAYEIMANKLSKYTNIDRHQVTIDGTNYKDITYDFKNFVTILKDNYDKWQPRSLLLFCHGGIIKDLYSKRYNGRPPDHVGQCEAHLLKLKRNMNGSFEWKIEAYLYTKPENTTDVRSPLPTPPFGFTPGSSDRYVIPEGNGLKVGHTIIKGFVPEPPTKSVKVYNVTGLGGGSRRRARRSRKTRRKKRSRR